MSNRSFVQADREQRVDFALLEPGRVISGVVRDALGGTIAAATVTLGAHPGLSDPGALARSDDEGHFELTAPDRAVMVTGYAPGYFPGSATVLARAGAEVELVLTPETLQRGRVVWDQDSRPAANTRVVAIGSGSQTTTDAQGRFELSLDVNRSNVLVASAPAGHANLELAAGPPGARAPVELRVGAGADLQLSLLVGSGGAKCEDGAVRLDERPTTALGWLPVSDEPIEIVGLALGRHVIRASCRGTMVLEQTVELVAGPQRVELVLDPAPALRGRVLGADGSPAALAQIELRGEESSSDVASLEGEFVVHHLPPGVYQLQARSERLGQGAVVEVDTRAGEVDMELRLDTWAGVHGRIVDGRGLPAAALSLSLTEGPTPQLRGIATTGPDGAFSFPAVRTGELRLFAGGIQIARAGQADFADRIELVHDSASSTELELIAESRARTLRLQILDQSGQALGGVQVGLLRPGEMLDLQLGRGTSALDGWVVFTDLPEGELALRWPGGELEALAAGQDSFALTWRHSSQSSSTCCGLR